MSAPKALLCIDAGNSFIKWCVHENSEVSFVDTNRIFSHATSGFMPTSGAATVLLAQLGSILNREDLPIAAVLLSNVLGAEFEQAVRTVCNQFSLPLHVLAVNGHLPLQTAYENPIALGKDRWASSLALTQCSSAPVNLLVSFGTATTLDVLIKTDTWKHCGGFIVPGVQTMFNSLHLGTVALPQLELGGPRLLGSWPVSTAQAISAGVGHMQIALIKSIAAELETQYQQCPFVWFCGGFAQQLLPHFPQAHLLENAVFKGLLFDYQLSGQGTE